MLDTYAHRLVHFLVLETAAVFLALSHDATGFGIDNFDALDRYFFQLRRTFFMSWLYSGHRKSPWHVRAVRGTHMSLSVIACALKLAHARETDTRRAVRGSRTD